MANLIARERPDFGPNRLELDGIKEGLRIRRHHTGDSPFVQEGVIVSGPFKRRFGLAVSVEYPSSTGRGTYQIAQYLGDMGVLPYNQGEPNEMWNQFNWTEVLG